MGERMYRYPLGNGYEFICWTYRTRKGYGHAARLFRGNTQVGSAQRTYEGRTWESFEYESAMMGAIEDYLRDYRENYLIMKKWDFGGKFPRGEKAKALAEFDALPEWVDLKERTKSQIWKKPELN